MSLRRAAGVARRHLLCSVYRRSFPFRGAVPIVSFTFDDFPRTAYIEGGAILKRWGVKGTYYVAMGLINTSNDLGEHFHLEDLHSLISDGHEVGSHTFGHSSSRRLPVTLFLEDVRRGALALAEATNFGNTAHFAYPYGHVTLAAKKSVGADMASCRGTIGGVNGPMLDLNLLRANSIYGHIDGLRTVERLLRQNEKQRGWLIFYTHDVRPHPSAFGCTPELFEAAVQLSVQSGAAVLRVDQAISHLTDNFQVDAFRTRE